jgi:hypothetical protein
MDNSCLIYMRLAILPLDNLHGSSLALVAYVYVQRIHNAREKQ